MDSESETNNSDNIDNSITNPRMIGKGFINILYSLMLLALIVLTVIIIVDVTEKAQSSETHAEEEHTKTHSDDKTLWALFGTTTGLTVFSFIFLYFGFSKLLLGLSLIRFALNFAVLFLTEKSSHYCENNYKLKLYMSAHTINALTLFFNVVQALG